MKRIPSNETSPGPEFRSVAGKTAIVTGGSRGLGEGIARTLASEGVHITIADIRPEVEETAAAIRKEHSNVHVDSVVLDVTDEQGVADAVQTVAARHGHLDIMVNNAGIHIPPRPVVETNLEDVERLWAVNFKGIFHGCKWAARQMIEQGSGTIVNIGSFFGKVGHAGSAAYGAAKAGVHTLTSSLALELAPHRITVNALCPGLAATEMHWSFVATDAARLGISENEMKEQELASIPLSRFGYGQDMAGAILWLASESGSYVTGQSINVNGGLDFS